MGGFAFHSPAFKDVKAPKEVARWQVENQVATTTKTDAGEQVGGRSLHDVVVYNTFIVPQGRPTTVNIPGNERRCGPPSDVSQCKEGGWAMFNFPNPFDDQGDCVRFVRHRPHTVLPVPLDPLKRASAGRERSFSAS